MDPEETRMRTAAHHMVKFMTAGMALITCREPLLVSISNNIKQALLTSVCVLCSTGTIFFFIITCFRDVFLNKLAKITFDLTGSPEHRVTNLCGSLVKRIRLVHEYLNESSFISLY